MFLFINASFATHQLRIFRIISSIKLIPAYDVRPKSNENDLLRAPLGLHGAVLRRYVMYTVGLPSVEPEHFKAYVTKAHPCFLLPPWANIHRAQRKLRLTNQDAKQSTTLFCLLLSCSQSIWTPRTDVSPMSPGAFEKRGCESAPRHCKNVTLFPWQRVDSHTHPFFTHLPTLTWHWASSLLFFKMKTDLGRHHFGTVEDVQRAGSGALNILSHADFRRCWEEWQHHWNWVYSQVTYFEGGRA